MSEVLFEYKITPSFGFYGRYGGYSVTIYDDGTVIREFSANYYCEPHDGCGWQDKDRYCVLVKWSDFENSPGTYIDEAFEKRSADVAGRIKIKNLR